MSQAGFSQACATPLCYRLSIHVTTITPSFRPSHSLSGGCRPDYRWSRGLSEYISNGHNLSSHAYAALAGKTGKQYKSNLAMSFTVYVQTHTGNDATGALCRSS